MVDWCPDESNDLIKAKCTRDPTTWYFNYTYLVDVPVISSNSGIIYQNIFCGKCHNENYFNDYNYDLSCDCEISSVDSLSNIIYQNGNLTWSGPRPSIVRCMEMAHITCVLSVKYPEKIGMTCEETLIADCAAVRGVFGNMLKDGCIKGENYYVQDKESNIYKNYNCSLCNGKNMYDLMCLLPYENTGTAKKDLWTISDLFSFDDKCDFNHVSDPVFGNCDVLENIPEILSSTEVNEYWNNSSLVGQEAAAPSASSITFMVLMTISIVCLLLHMIIFIILRKEANLHSKNLFSMSFALFSAEIIFVFAANLCHDYLTCYILTLIVYYFFLAAFLWMNVISFDICKTFLSPNLRSHSSQTFIKYSLYAWGVALVVVLCALMVDQLAAESQVAPGFAIKGFWFANIGGLLMFFVIPVEILFSANLIMFVISIIEIRKQKQFSKFASTSVSDRTKYVKQEGTLKSDRADSNKLHKIITGKVKTTLADHEKHIKMLKLDASLAVLMGVPWIFAILVNVSVVFEYMFNIVNSLQGVFIFVAFDCKSKVWNNLKGKSRTSSERFPVKGTSDNSTSSSRLQNSSVGVKANTQALSTYRAEEKAKRDKMRNNSNSSKLTLNTVISQDAEENLELMIRNTQRHENTIVQSSNSHETAKLTDSSNEFSNNEQTSWSQEKGILVVPTCDEAAHLERPHRKHEHRQHEQHEEEHENYDHPRTTWPPQCDGVGASDSSDGSPTLGQNKSHRRRRNRRRREDVLPSPRPRNRSQMRNSPSPRPRNRSQMQNSPNKAYVNSDEECVDV